MTRATPRQREVLDLCCERCLSARETAEIMSVSTTTVRTYMAALLRRYGVRSMRGVCYQYGRDGRIGQE